MRTVIKRNGLTQEFNFSKIENAIKAAFNAQEKKSNDDEKSIELVLTVIKNSIDILYSKGEVTVELIQDAVEKALMACGHYDIAKSYILYRAEHKSIRDFADKKIAFIEKYKKSDNTANATIDDNSNVSNHNVAVLNAEIHKEDNIKISRRMVLLKLKELYPDFDAKQYERDLNHHIIYKHDESSFAGAIAPYCCSISMYPFLTDGIKNLGGLSASPKNLDSFCGMYINLIFAISPQFAGACATSEFLVYFDHYARKEWGNDYYLKAESEITINGLRKKTILSQIHQYWQQVIYSINQPAAARGMQAAFVNFSYFDKYFFEGMFRDFVFPDGDKPSWDSICWIQKEFMQWFNKERLKCIITFPVESVSLLYKDGKFQDEDMFNFVCKEYSEGHSFFTYISDSVDSLSSCCRLRNALQTKEFNFTNGNIGIMTGSKSVITLNLNRIIQDFFRQFITPEDFTIKEISSLWNNPINNPGTEFEWNTRDKFKEYLVEILERVYKYHTAYNELLWDMFNADMLPAYKAGFINLNKQYLTIGINGLNQAAEVVGMKCTDNNDYKSFCQFIFSTISEQNKLHKTSRTNYNTEQVPAESLAIKNYNWDKNDGYWVPDDTNLYASYVFKPNDDSTSVLEKLRLHGREYIGDFIDGGAACHINLDSHLSEEQYRKLITYAANEGVNYFTFNVPNCECEDCGYIAKQPFAKCPKCGSTNIALWDRVIGYLTKIKNWSVGRQQEQKTRVYSKEKIEC